MRIALLLDAYKPIINGITTFVSLHKRALEEAGHEPWIITLGHTDYQDDEFRVVRSKAVPLSNTGYHINFGYNREIRELLRTMDILHVHHPFLSGAMATTLGPRYGVPVLFTSHTRYDLYAQQYLPILPATMSDTFLETFFPAFAQRCSLVIAPSAGIQEVLRRWGVQGRIEVVPNGIELEHFRAPDWHTTRSALGLSETGAVAVFVGRMSGEKNIQTLLRAFAPVTSECPDAHLLMIGGGPELDDFRKLTQEMGIASQVLFTGPIPYEHMPGYLALADFFVTASVSEVHPMTVLEAMASGLPVLGIDSPGISDTVVNGQNGFVVQHDYAALALKMLRLFSEPELRASLAAGARQTSTHYDIHTTTQRYVEIYEEQVRQRRPARRRWWTQGRR
ncbi:MAG: glycosyltransferase [Anaerolineae bacterium]